MLSSKDYHIPRWGEKFSDTVMSFDDIYLTDKWREVIMDTVKEQCIAKQISSLLKNSDCQINMYPYPDLLWSALNHTDYDDIKTVILGQDPYHGTEFIDGIEIPQAMGISFSVPLGIKAPSSLVQIYSNQIKYKNIMKKPIHGNLEFWAYQGCLMLNSSLTVQKNHPGSHMDMWSVLTDHIIKKISDDFENIVFVLWGAPSLTKLQLIDTNKHKIIISSHPSGLSCHNTLRNYPAFVNQDHFGKINKYLKKYDKDPILWQIV